MDRGLEIEPEEQSAEWNRHFDFAGVHSSSVADWVDGFLRGPGGNLALADGLRLAPRRWEGPLWLPLTALTRCCGPEEQMEYVVEADSWERRLAGLAAHLASGGTLPPLSPSAARKGCR